MVKNGELDNTFKVQLMQILLRKLPAFMRRPICALVGKGRRTTLAKLLHYLEDDLASAKRDAVLVAMSNES